MDKQEQYLKARFGRKDAFRVPDGYFDSLASHIADRLPEQTQQMTVVPRHNPRRWIAAAAAVACLIALSTVAWLGHAEQDSQTATAQETSIGAEEQLIDYAVLDNNDIYAYMAEY